MQGVDQRNMRWPLLFTDEIPIPLSDNRTCYIFLYTNREEPYSEHLENVQEKKQQHTHTHTSKNYSTITIRRIKTSS